MAVTIEYLGHSGFLIHAEVPKGDFKVLIDPYLTDNPVATHKPGEIVCTHICVTHGHFDHLGDTAAISRSNAAKVYANFEICEELADLAGPTEGMNTGGRVDTEFGFVALTQAFHSSSFQGKYMGMPCGVVLRFEGAGEGGKDLTVYHAGDTDLFSDMKLIGEIYQPDIAMLPIGDRFTMGPELAAKAAELIKPKVAIPIHHGTWPPITVDVSRFKPNGIEVKVMKPADVWELPL